MSTTYESTAATRQRCPGCGRYLDRDVDDLEHQTRVYECVTTPDGVRGCGARWCPSQTRQALELCNLRRVRGKALEWIRSMARQIDSYADSHSEFAAGELSALSSYLEHVAGLHRDALSDATSRVLGLPTWAERMAKFAAQTKELT